MSVLTTGVGMEKVSRGEVKMGLRRLADSEVRSWWCWWYWVIERVVSWRSWRMRSW
jgi:hypothetical protein